MPTMVNVFHDLWNSFQHPVNYSFEKNLGTVSYQMDNITYTASISDNNYIVDKIHKKSFQNCILWMKFIQQKYSKIENK